MVNSKVIDMSDVMNSGGMAARIAQALVLPRQRKKQRRSIRKKSSSPVKQMWTCGTSFQTKSWTGF